MKRSLLILFIFTLLISVLLWVSYRTFLDQGSRRFIDYLSDHAMEYGIELQDPLLDKTEIGALDTLRARHFSSLIRVRYPRDSSNFYKYSIALDQASLRIKNLFKGKYIFYVEGLSLVAHQAYRGEDVTLRNLSRLEFDSLQLEFQVRLHNFKPGMRRLAENLVSLLSDGRSDLPIQIQGKSIFYVGEKLTEAEISVVMENEQYFLAVAQSIVRGVADYFDLDLTDAEVKLLSHHPLQMPKLFKIQNRASDKARQVNRGNPSIPEESYRHILWSYYLTKNFGEDFALKVTEAHEIGSRDSAAEQTMDRRNNDRGRKYAKDRVSEDLLVDKVLTDSRVVRSLRELSDE